MIHQCYFEDAQRSRLFDSPLYRGFGLYSAVNPAIARNCPELEDPANQRRLSEYAAMLHHWRNPELDSDPWIGFTSYRQLDKVPTILHDRKALEEALCQHDVLGWGFYSFFHVPSGRSMTLAEQGEYCHSGMTACLQALLGERGEALPASYRESNTGLFCNYWVMSRQSFNQLMLWSYPLVRRCLDQPQRISSSEPRFLAYLAERLFICWYGLTNKRLANVGQVVHFHYGHRTGSQPPLTLPAWNATLLEVCLRHRITPGGILHVGAPQGEEREAYRQLGVRRVLWVVADPRIVGSLRANFLAPTDGPSDFSSANASASLLTLARQQGIDATEYDFLVMDVQGAALLAFRGFSEDLRHFQGVWIEVNLKPSDPGCPSLSEVDTCLAGFGLHRRETLLTPQGTGQALYLRTGACPQPPADLGQRYARAREQLMAQRSFTLQRQGQEQRVLELLEDSRIGLGQGPLERSWLLRASGHEVLLELVGDPGRTCLLLQRPGGTWEGASVVGPAMPIRLIPRGLVPLGSQGPSFDTTEELTTGAQKSQLQVHGSRSGADLVSLVILCANQLSYTQLCLESVVRHTRPPFELVLVDNASSDGTPAYLETLAVRIGSDRVRVLRNQTNRGFAAGCNQGAALARGRFLLFINNDTIVTPHWIEGLIKGVRQHGPRAGLVGAVSNATAAPQRIAVDYPRLEDLEAFAARRWREHGRQTVPAWRLTGLCLLAPREVLDRIGLFDECFGLGFFEDYDLCARAHRAGYELILAPGVFIHHFGSQTFAGLGLDRNRRLSEAYRLFLTKWGPEVTARYAPDFLPPPPEVLAHLSFRARHALAVLHHSQGRIQEAETLWREIIPGQPAFTPAWLGLGDVFLVAGRLAQAAELIGQLTRQQPGSMEGAVLQARLQVAARNPAAALASLTQVAVLVPFALRAKLGVAQEAIQKGPNWEATEKSLREISGLLLRLAITFP